MKQMKEIQQIEQIKMEAEYDSTNQHLADF